MPRLQRWPDLSPDSVDIRFLPDTPSHYGMRWMKTLRYPGRNSCNQPERSLKVTLQQEKNEEQWWTRLLGFIQTHLSAALQPSNHKNVFQCRLQGGRLGDRFLLRTGLGFSDGSDWPPLAQLTMLHLTMSHTDTRKLTWTAWDEATCHAVRDGECAYFTFLTMHIHLSLQLSRHISHRNLPCAVVESIFPRKATFVGTSITTVDGWGR